MEWYYIAAITLWMLLVLAILNDIANKLDRVNNFHRAYCITFDDLAKKVVDVEDRLENIDNMLCGQTKEEIKDISLSLSGINTELQGISSELRSIKWATEIKSCK